MLAGCEERYLIQFSNPLLDGKLMTGPLVLIGPLTSPIFQRADLEGRKAK